MPPKQWDKDWESSAMAHPDSFHDDNDNSSGDIERSSLLPFTYDNGEIESHVRRRSQSRGALGYVVDAWNRRRGRRQDGPQEQRYGLRRAKFSATMRTLFNYPEPGLEVRKTGWLDALRGLAAFQVFIYHYAGQWLTIDDAWGAAPDNNPNAWWAATYLRLWYACGPSAVCFFFTISGYAISVRTLGLIRRRQINTVLHSLSSAVMRRGIRLYIPVLIPQFCLMTAGYFFGFPKCTGWTPLDTYFQEVGRWYDFVTKSWMPVHYPDRLGDILNGYDGAISWTIPLEYYGSIVTFVALLFTARIRKFGVRAALFALFMFMYTTKQEWYVVQFLVGAVYAEYQMVAAERQERFNASGAPAPKRSHVTATNVAKVSLLLFGLHIYSMPNARLQTGPDEHPAVITPRPGWNWIVGIAQYFGLYDVKSAQIDRFILGFGANCVLIAVGEIEVLRRLLHKRPFQYLGRISFGLYLSHVWVKEFINLLTPFILSQVGLDNTVGLYEQPVNFRYVMAYWIRMIISIPINLMIGGIFERTIDRWAINLGKRFENFVNKLGGAEDDDDDGKAFETIGTSRPSLPGGRRN